MTRKKPNTRKPSKKGGSRRRRNGDELAHAAEAYEKFHGKPPGRVTKTEEIVKYADKIFKLGAADYLDIETRDGKVVRIKFKKATDVCATADGRQLYLVGGDQSVDLKKFGLEPGAGKHQVELGTGVEIAYITRKSFDDFKLISYHHEFGEDGGEQPTVAYDTLNDRIYLVGGDYEIEDVDAGDVSGGILD